MTEARDDGNDGQPAHPYALAHPHNHV